LYDKYKELKNIEEFLNSRISSLDLELKRQYDGIDNLQAENENLSLISSPVNLILLVNQISMLEGQLKSKIHLDKEIQDKNNEIVKLERRLKELENVYNPRHFILNFRKTMRLKGEFRS